MNIPSLTVAGQAPPLLLVPVALLVGMRLSAFVNNPTSFMHKIIS